MTDLLKISIIFALIMLLLRKKIHVGFVMLIAASLLLALYQMSITAVLRTCEGTVLNSVTIKLLLSLSFIRILELILREHQVLTEMMKAIKSLFRSRKIVTISMPLLIGLMPSIGGAYFSAPMVAETTRDTEMSREEKGFVNYWFRHPWEFMLPLYPGILLASAISKMELYHLIIVNLTYAFLMLISGFLFSMHSLKGFIPTENRLSKKGLWSFVPITAVLLLVVIFHIELQYALIAVVFFLLVFYRYNLKSIFSAFRHGFSPEVILLIVGVMFFKEAMENSGAVHNLSQFLLQKGIPVFPILFLLPFITGILTGITVGFVGSTFPLIVSLAQNASVGTISFAFASGFIGVLLSPVHICLVLTREYFKADLWKMYKMMMPASLVVFIGAVVQYWILR